MQRTVHASEEPSRISQALVVCFSIAVVLMAGWLALTIMLSRYVTGSAIDADIVTSAPVSAPAPVSMPVHMENVSDGPDEPSVTARLNSAFDLLPRGVPSATAAPARSALPLASPTEPPPPAIYDLGYPPLSTATAAQDASYRSIPAVEPLGARTAIEATDATADLTPAPPPPRRGRTTPVPVPRPRPPLEAEEVQPVQDLSLLELLFGRQQ